MKMPKQFFLYILASRKNGFLYTGMTSDLKKRVWEHKNEIIEGHTKSYNIKNLVYFEVYENFEAVALREKRIKRWKRVWKDALIEKENPDWKDLYSEI